MRRVVRLLTATLLCAALSQTVLAQSGETLDRHRLALDNLQASVDNLGTDSSASLDALEAAASTMRLVARDTDSSTLVPALEQAVANARTAITNQSGADLAVQTAVLRGGFQRALLEAALSEGSAGQARAGFSQLSSELDLDEQTSTAIAFARETATFSRLRLKRNSTPRGMSSPLLLAIEKKTTGASRPWNLSTVPTSTPTGSACRSVRTCML